MLKSAHRMSGGRLFAPQLRISLSLAATLFVAGAIAGCAPYVSHPDQPTSGASPSSLGTSTEKSSESLMAEAMSGMHRAMTNVAMTGDPDRDFAAIMIPHHQGAIDMAKVELLYGRDPTLRRLAQEMIVIQEQEVAVMQLRLRKRKAK